MHIHTYMNMDEQLSLEAGLSLSLFLEKLQEEIPGEGGTAILLTCS